MTSSKRVGKSVAALEGTSKRGSKPVQLELWKAPPEVQAIHEAVVPERAPVSATGEWLTRDVMAAVKIPFEQQQQTAQPVMAELKQGAAESPQLVALIPELATVEGKLRKAIGWTVESKQAWAWSQHADYQKAMAWTEAMADLEAIRRSLEFFAQRDPTLPQRFPMLFAFFAYRTDAAQRGADARKEREARKNNTDKKDGEPTT